MPVRRKPKKSQNVMRSRSAAEWEKIRLTERVDNAVLLLLDVLETTDPLPAIPHHTDSGRPVWALESRNEEVPCSQKRRIGNRRVAEKRMSAGPRARTLTRKETYRVCNTPIPSMATWNFTTGFQWSVSDVLSKLRDGDA